MFLEIVTIIDQNWHFWFLDFQKMKNAPSQSLLKLFTVLMEEENLGRAAARLQMPASSASRHLSELRDFFDDPLFTRSAERLVATPKAKDLLPKVRTVLAGYEALADHGSFDLETIRRRVRIGCVDNAVIAFCRHLVAETLEKAPGISFDFFPLPKDRLQQLRTGVLDFIISPLTEVEPGFHSLKLGTHDYALVCAPNHPILKALEEHPDGVPDEEFLKYGFVDVVFQFDCVTDARSLRETACPQWAEARTVARTGYFLPVLSFLAEAPLLAILPRRTADFMTADGRLAIVPTETKSNCHSALLIWHDRIHNDSVMQWVRSMICTSARL